MTNLTFLEENSQNQLFYLVFEVRSVLRLLNKTHGGRNKDAEKAKHIPRKPIQDAEMDAWIDNRSLTQRLPVHRQQSEHILFFGLVPNPVPSIHIQLFMTSNYSSGSPDASGLCGSPHVLTAVHTYVV